MIRYEEVFSEYFGYPPLNREEEEKLLNIYCSSKTKNQEVEELLIRHNFLLVLKIAHSYLIATDEAGVKDLVQEGLIGLIRGLRCFDNNRGIKLSTHITYWIKQAILKYLGDNGDTVRFPAHIRQIRSKIRKIEESREEFVDDITMSEILNIPLNLVRKHRGTSGRALPIEYFVNTEDTYIDEDSMECIEVYSEEIEDPCTPLDEIIASTKEDEIREVVDSLPKRQAIVIKGLYGFDGDRLTLRKIAKTLGLSAQAIANIRDAALQILHRRFIARGIK